MEDKVRRELINLAAEDQLLENPRRHRCTAEEDSGLLRNVDPGPSWSVGFSYYLAIEPALSFAFLVFGRKAFSPGLRGRLTPVMGRF
jgi:hypothetical protein